MGKRMIFDQVVVPSRFTILDTHDNESVLTSETAIPLADFYKLLGREDAPSTIGVTPTLPTSPPLSSRSCFTPPLPGGASHRLLDVLDARRGE